MRPLRLIAVSFLLATAVPFLGGGAAVALGGEPDPTFDGGGVRIDTSRPVLDVANAASTDYFGPVTVAGAAGERMAVARYSASGEAAEFGGDGLVTADFGVPAVAHAVAGLSDVIAVGEAGGDLAAAVFDRIGQPQLSFGRSGRLVVPLVGRSVGEAVTDSGLVAGWVVRNGHRDVLLAQLSASGLDTTFNGTGTKVIDLAPGADDAAFAIVDVASGGRFYLAGQMGSAAVVARFSGGSLDPGFGIAGLVVLDVTAGADVARAIRVDNETGQLIVAGQAGARAFVARLTADGAPVPAFGGSGVVQVDLGGSADVATAVAAWPGGAVLVSGTRTTSSGTDGAARRLTGAGVVDTAFGDAGLVVADFGGTSDRANALGVQRSDGRFVLVGDNGADVVMAGFTASGGTDAAFGTAGKVVRDGGSPSSDLGHVVRLHPDGRIVVLGSAGGQLVLARRLPDGRPDHSFGAGGPVLDDFGNASALDAVAQADGSLLVLVSIVDASRNSTGRVVRYLADGRRDPSFGRNGDGAAVNGPGARSSLRVLADGRILVAGTSWTGYNGVARLLPDGTPDVAFGDRGFASVGALGTGGAIGVQSDGNIILAVVARDVYAAVHVARLTAGGAVDSSFGYLLHGVGGFPVVRVLPDDRLYVAGSVSRGTGSGNIETDAITIARLGRDGYPDATFGSNGVVRVDPGTSETVTDAVLDGPFLAVLGVFIDGANTLRATLLRLTASGALDDRYGSNGTVVLDGSRSPWGLARDDEGRLLVVGTRPGPPDADIDLVRLQAGPSTEATPPTTTSPTTTSPTTGPGPVTTSPTTAPRPVTTVTQPAPAPRRVGYWMVSRAGGTYAFGDAGYLGGAPTASAVDIEPTPTGRGYWIVDVSGSVYALGDARYAGGLNGTRLAGGEEVTSLAATPSGGGYWLFTTRGRAVPFGDATFRGDMAGVPLNGPVLDSVVTPSGLGYYLVASDGGIFAFGDARFHGAMGGRRLNAPVQSLVPDGDGTGYWLVASDGGVFAFDAPFRGSMGGARLSRPVTGMVRFGNGYLMVGEDGGIFNFSDRKFLGSLGASPPPSPITSVAALDQQ